MERENWHIKIAFVNECQIWGPFFTNERWADLGWLRISNAIMMRITNDICFISFCQPNKDNQRRPTNGIARRRNEIECSLITEGKNWNE